MTKPDYRKISSQVFINAPWYELKNRYLDLFISNHLQPEIGFEGLCLYEEKEEEFIRIAKILQENNLECTMHAPFFDLAPGALDPHILKASRNKLRKAFQLIEIFKPRSIVCHLNYESDKQGYKQEEWETAAYETWHELSQAAARHNSILMLENTYEKNPAAHETILSRLDSKSARFCLDVGHLMSFAKTDWQEWLPRLSPWLGQLHLHDNDGNGDDHIGMGLGSFDFESLFQFLARNKMRPIITLEPHSEEALWQSLAYLKQTKLLDILDTTHS